MDSAYAQPERILRFLSHAATLLLLCTPACSPRSEKSLVQPTARPRSEQIPAPIAPQSPLSVVVMSDLNGWAGETEYGADVHRAINWTLQQRPQLVVLPGDLIAIERTEPEANIRAMWSSFEAVVARPLADAGIPFAFAFGNHDTPDALSRQVAAEFWNQRKSMLGVNFVQDREFPFRYSFRLGGAHFWAWDTNTGSVQDNQWAFARADLASEAARNAELRIGIAHVPLYGMATARNKPGELILKYQELESFLADSRTGVYITGHHHAFFPALNSGIHFVHNGCLGGGERQLLGTTTPAYKEFTRITLSPGSARPVTVEGIHGRTLETVPRATLPDTVTGFDGRTAHLDPEYR